MKTFINRFFEEREIPTNLTFNKNFGDVIMLDGRYQIITGFGIYDNQMWTEKIYEDGCHLGAGNYEFVEKAVLVKDETIRQSVIDAYKKELSDNFYRHQTNFYSDAQLKSHLCQYA